MDEIVFRSSFLKTIREAMQSQSFIEVETPLLTRSSPEVGRNEYIIESCECEYECKTNEHYTNHFQFIPQSHQNL